MKKIFLFSNFVIISSASLLVACSHYVDYQNPQTFISSFNNANKIFDFSTLENKNNNLLLKQLDNLTNLRLFRYKTTSKPLINYANLTIEKPTEVSKKLEFANAIFVHAQESSIINEATDLKTYSFYTDLTDKLDAPENFGTYLNSYAIARASDNLYNSINSDFFEWSLQKAKKIEISLRPNLFWSDYLGQRQNHKINAESVYYGMMNVLLRNKNFRQQFLNTSELKEMEQLNYVNEIDYFNGIDYLAILNNLGIDTNKLLNKNTFIKDENTITIYARENSEKGLLTFFESLLIESPLFQPIFFDASKNEILDKLNFYNYGKTFKDRFYAGNYVINKNSPEEILLKLNEHFWEKSWINNPQKLETIIYSFNALPLNSDYFAQQNFENYQQKIISRSDFTNLNNSEKQKILSDPATFGLSYTTEYNSSSSIKTSQLNLIPSENKINNFNNLFANLFYGTNLNQIEKGQTKIADLFSKDVIAFRTYLMSALNFSLFAKQVSPENDYWLSSVPVDLALKRNFENLLEYQSAKDAYLWINKIQVIQDNEKNINIFNDDNDKLYFDLNNSLDLEKRMQSSKYSEIQESLKKLLDNFYNLNNLTQKRKIEWIIPIDTRILTNSQKNIYLKLEEFYGQLDSRLKPKVALIENQADYEKYFINENSIFKNFSLNLTESTFSNYLEIFIKDNNYQNLILLFAIFANPKLKDIFPELLLFSKNLFEQITYQNLVAEKNNLFFEINLEQWSNFNLKQLNNLKKILFKTVEQEAKFSKFLKLFINAFVDKNLNNFKMINLINQITNLKDLTIEAAASFKVNSLEKKLIQNYLDFPSKYRGIEYLQDVRIRKEL
ncbi:hypothetical protein NV226_02095 [Mycoplasma iguanae]|uniref:Lipoprotein n=1 Tax=Mycoplasma iguanae TaxID=292461 RepID=A0ABY5R871_9MOLU|nr:hypothetical protein [Mycoplasma iguanae]UVD81506.1 hypothetical protein NV226_02095 [Mycoplasma iguanae]